MGDDPDDEFFLRAATECLDAAQATVDPNARVALLSTAQKWLHLANRRRANDELNRALDAFNEEQILKAKK